MRERALLQHVIDHTDEGDTEAVLSEMDTYWDGVYKTVGSDAWKLRSQAVDDLVKKHQPLMSLELGTYCGYTALRIARLIPEDAQLVSVEIDPLHAAIATKIIEHAGMRDKVRVVIGTVESRLQYMQNKLGLNKINALFIDHMKGQYLPDLKTLEKAGLMGAGTVVMCDTSTYPGDSATDDIEGYIQHVNKQSYLNTQTIMMTKKDLAGPQTSDQEAEAAILVSTYWEGPVA